MKARKKVITALDYKNMDDVKSLVELLGDEIEYYNIERIESNQISLF